IRLPGRPRILGKPQQSTGDITDIDRLELRLAAADQRQRWRETRQRREPVEETVLRSEDGARPRDGRSREGSADALFARSLGPRFPARPRPRTRGKRIAPRPKAPT